MSARRVSLRKAQEARGSTRRSYLRGIERQPVGPRFPRLLLRLEKFLLFGGDDPLAIQSHVGLKLRVVVNKEAIEVEFNRKSGEHLVRDACSLEFGQVSRAQVTAPPMPTVPDNVEVEDGVADPLDPFETDFVEFGRVSESLAQESPMAERVIESFLDGLQVCCGRPNLAGFAVQTRKVLQGRDRTDLDACTTESQHEDQRTWSRVQPGRWTLPSDLIAMRAREKASRKPERSYPVSTAAPTSASTASAIVLSPMIAAPGGGLSFSSAKCMFGGTKWREVNGRETRTEGTPWRFPASKR